MKNMIMRSIVALSALLAVTLAPAMPTMNGDGSLTGVWRSQVTLTDCNGHTLVAFEALEMFNAGGTLTSTDNTPPGGQGPGFGTWNRVGHEMYSAPFQFFNFNPDGSFAGTQKITRTITVGRDGNHYTSVVNFGSYDPNGNLLFSGCGTETATRLP